MDKKTKKFTTTYFVSYQTKLSLPAFFRSSFSPPLAADITLDCWWNPGLCDPDLCDVLENVRRRIHDSDCGEPGIEFTSSVIVIYVKVIIYAYC